MPGGGFSPPKFRPEWQQKNEETYTHARCEQLVGKFALKWFFGSQLLRPHPVLVRFATVLFHVFDDPRAYPAVTPKLSLSSSVSYISVRSTPFLLTMAPKFRYRETTPGEPIDMPKIAAAGAV
jgi:hypothetical protein